MPRAPARKRHKRKIPNLPRLVRGELRRVFMDLMLGLDRLFRETLEDDTGFNAREILEIRPVYQCVLREHLEGRRSTAHGIAKIIGIPRTTTRRCLDQLVRIGWLARHRSHYWISAETARLPVMPRSAYRKAAKLVEHAAKQLQAYRKK